MADEQARPLTAEEIDAIRAANVASPPSWLIPRLLATIAERDTTLDAWRPVLEAVAALNPGDRVAVLTVKHSRHLLGQDS